MDASSMLLMMVHLCVGSGLSLVVRSCAACTSGCIRGDGGFQRTAGSLLRRELLHCCLLRTVGALASQGAPQPQPAGAHLLRVHCSVWRRPHMRLARCG